jgi:hypothetical protein
MFDIQPSKVTFHSVQVSRKSATARVKQFKIGAAYDIVNVGLAVEDSQPCPASGCERT